MQSVLDYLPIVMFVVIGGAVTFGLFTKRGKGMMLGGRIVHSARDEVRQSRGLLRTALRAHVVEARDGNRHVGIEIYESAKLGASFKPVQLSRSEARTLIGMLEEVVAKT